MASQFLQPFLNVGKISFLEWLTGLISVGGLTVGIYSFINPSAAARIYGIPIYDLENESSISLILGARTPLDTKRQSPPDSSRESDGGSLALIHALGIRNFTAGLTILALTTYGHSLSVEDGAVNILIQKAVQRALGFVVLIGALVPVVDGWVCLQHSRRVQEKRVTLHGQEVKVGSGHSDVWEGYKSEFEIYATGRKAGKLHLARSLVWIAGGLCCLLW